MESSEVSAEVDQFRKRASFDLAGSKSPHAIALVPRLEWIICMASFKGNDQQYRGGAVPDKVSRPVP